MMMLTPTNATIMATDRASSTMNGAVGKSDSLPVIVVLAPENKWSKRILCQCQKLGEQRACLQSYITDFGLCCMHLPWRVVLWVLV